METIRKLGWVESLCALNFFTFLLIWWFDGGLYKGSEGVVFAIDITTFIPWLVTAVPAVVASVYGLLRLHDVYGHDERTRRLVVCSICLFANAALLAVMIVPNGAFTFHLTNLYFAPKS